MNDVLAHEAERVELVTGIASETTAMGEEIADRQMRRETGNISSVDEMLRQGLQILQRAQQHVAGQCWNRRGGSSGVKRRTHSLLRIREARAASMAINQAGQP